MRTNSGSPGGRHARPHSYNLPPVLSSSCPPRPRVARACGMPPPAHSCTQIAHCDQDALCLPWSADGLGDCRPGRPAVQPPEHGQAFSWQLHVETVEYPPLYRLHVCHVNRPLTAIGDPVIAPLADRDYGLRDLTIADPNGFSVRFGTRIAKR